MNKGHRAYFKEVKNEAELANLREHIFNTQHALKKVRLRYKKQADLRTHQLSIDQKFDNEALAVERDRAEKMATEK